MRRQYKSPPLLEVVCEITLDTPDWDPTLPGLLYNLVKEDYPTRKAQQMMSFGLKLSPESLEQNVQPTLRAQFWSMDESAVIQFAKRQLVINRREPYACWEEYRERILRAFQSVQQITSVIGIPKVQILCLNRLKIKPEGSLADLFRYGPSGIPDEFQGFSSFLWGLELSHPETLSILKIELASMDQEDQEKTVRLDLTCESTNLISSDLSRLSDWLDLAHDKLSTAFENCITDQARRQFEVLQ